MLYPKQRFFEQDITIVTTFMLQVSTIQKLYCYQDSFICKLLVKGVTNLTSYNAKM